MAEKKFTEAWTDAETGIHIGNTEDLGAGYYRRTRSMSNLERTWEYLEALCDEESLAKIDALSISEFEAFQERYNTFCGAPETEQESE